MRSMYPVSQQHNLHHDGVTFFIPFVYKYYPYNHPKIQFRPGDRRAAKRAKYQMEKIEARLAKKAAKKAPEEDED